MIIRKCKHAKENCRRSCKLRNRKWTVVQNNPTQRKWKMGSLFIISNTRKVPVKHIKYVSQQPISYAPGSVENISDNEKAILFSEYASKLQKYIEACTLCQRTKVKNTKQRPYYGCIPTDYIPCENLAVDLKKMPLGIVYYEYLLIATCEKTNFVYAIPLQNQKTQTIADALLHRVFFLTGPPTKFSIDQDSALTSQVIKELLMSLECTMQIISPWNHGSSKAERQIQTIGNIINKHLTAKGASWPLYASVSAYAMNTFASTALQGLSPFELVFARKPRHLSSFKIPKITSFPNEYREFFSLLLERAKMYSDMDLEW